MSEIIICASPANAMHEQCIQEVLCNFKDNIRVFTDEHRLRSFLKDNSDSNQSVWVFGGGEVSAINIAAGLVADGFDADVHIVADEITGSFASRVGNLVGVSIVAIEDFGNVVKDWIAQSCDNNEMSLQESTIADVNAKIDDGQTTLLDDADSKNDLPSQSASTITFPTQEIGGEGGSRIEIPSFVVSVIATSGGSGKSSISALMSYLSARKGFKTLCLDLDLQFGDICQLCGIESPITMDDFLENPQAIYEIANAQPEHLPVVIAPPMRLERGEVVNRYIGKIISCAAPYFDVIVVNTGAVWIDCHAQLLELSDKAMFVVDQRASSVRSTRHALDLCFRLGISNSDFVFLLNRCSRASTFTAVDISCALDGGLVYEVKDGGSVVEESLGSGHVEDLATSKNEMITSLSEALDKVFETSAKVSALKRRAAATPLADANLYASVSQETRGKRRGLLHKSKDRKHRDAVSDTVLKPSGNMAEAIQWA